jgi:8-oxo-(d)GTP phosphatase
MRRVLLVRHARAGDRRRWDGADRLRPLDARGRRQAEALVDVLGSFGVERLLSSPYLRCVQTLEPTAAALGIALEEADELAEGATRSELAGLLDRLGSTSVAALCTHGDVIDEVVERDAAKGSVWELELDRGALRPLRYLPPPA